MLGFILRRGAVALTTLIVVLAVVFFALQLLPGGYVDVVLGPRASEQSRSEAEERFGLDQPVIVQFFRWFVAALHGDLGVSLVSKEPVLQELALRLPVTLQLTVMALIISVVVGVSLGLVAGLARRRRVLQGSVRMFGLLSLSIPDFVVGMVLLLLATVGAWGLTGRGYVPFGEDPLASITSTLLASITLGLSGIALVMRTLHDSIAATMTEPFISSAVARGDRPGTIVRRHVLRNSSAPSVNVIALLIGMFIGGTVVVETIFSLPGLGLFFANSVRNRDFAVVQGIVLISATVFIVANMLADVAHVLLDPRLAKTTGVSK